MDSENLICFNFVIDLHGNQDPDAWDRILDAFLEAVEKEGGGAGGGIHRTGTNKFCDICQDEEDDGEL